VLLCGVWMRWDLRGVLAALAFLPLAMLLKGARMENSELEKLLRAVAAGEVAPDEAVAQLRVQPFQDLGFAKVDHHRAIRQGAGEVVYGEGKTPDQIADIVAALLDAGQECVLITRLDAASACAVQQLLSEGLVVEDEEDAAPAVLFTYYDLPRLAIVGEMPEPTGAGPIVIACGGTSDIPVAEEAALTAEMLGNEVKRLYDVGVAGLHRLLSHASELQGARVVVAVAGMEGALPSVVGGIVACPVIAVPTSVGYGASFGGVAALLAMLNSCASGVSVVNIDNGFGAGYLASLINHL